MTHAPVKDAFISIDMDENENIFTSYPAEAGRHVSFLTGFEDEVMGPEHSFLEHDCDKDLVGSHLGFGSYDLRKCFSVENLSCALEYDEIIDGDVVDSTLNVGEEMKTEFFDGMLQGPDEIVPSKKVLPLASKDSSIGSPSGHHIVTSYPCGESHLGENLCLQNKRQPFSEVDSVADISGLSSEDAGIESGKANSSKVFDLMSVKELQETFKSMFGRETIVVDKQWLKRRIIFGMQNNESNDRLNLIACDMNSSDDEGKIVLTSGTESSSKLLSSSTWIHNESIVDDSKPLATVYAGSTEICTSFQDKVDEVGVHVTGKRLHRPPRRYIEESLEPKSKTKRKRCEVFHKAPKTKLLGVKPQKQICHKVNEEPQSLLPEEPFDGACIQVPFGLPVEEEQLKDKTTCSTWSIVPTVPCHDSDNCPSNQSTISNERSDPECVSAKLLEYVSRDDRDMRTNIQKGKRRRKHHMPWTQSEVMKLIEGISHLGVGRWSKIKRLLFSSSKHRTSVDLKDKWRNLVKASSCIQLRKKRKGLQVRKPLSHQAPEPVLRRVRELANIYSLP